jgi:hypothetical protein
MLSGFTSITIDEMPKKKHVLLYKGYIFTSMYDVAFIMKIMESLEGLLDDALGGGDAKHTLWL